MEHSRTHRFTRRRSRHAPPPEPVIVGTLPSPAELQALNAAIRQSTLPDRLEGHLTAIRKSAQYVEELNKRRAATVGTVRDAYTTIITETLRDMLRLVDVYKVEVCDSIVEYESAAVLNTTRFPSFA